MPRLKLVFVINSLTGGGAERVMSKLLRSAVEYLDRYDIHFVMLDEEQQAYSVPDSIVTHRLNCKGGLIASVRQLHRVLRQIAPDVVVSFLTRANLANAFLAKLLGYRAIISERTNTSTHHAKGLNGVASKWLIRRLYPSAARVIAVSRGVAVDLSANFSIPQQLLEVIQNPFDIADLENLAAEPVELPTARPFVVGMGRLVPSKNFALLIDAFGAAKLDTHDLLILGHGPLEAELRARATAVGIGDRVHFVGFVQNPFPIIRRADSYVLCSNAEGFPNALVEAMSLGTPVVATDCPSGPAEILGSGTEGTATGLKEADYGIIVPINDRPAMTDALRLVSQSADHGRRGRLALDGASRYAADIAIGRYWSTINAVAKGERTASVARGHTGAPSEASERL